MTQAVTQEFQLSITPLGPDNYLLRTEAVAAGVPLAEAQVTWPLETWLAQSEALFQDPLQALFATSAAPSSTSDPWTQLGQTLYQGLFQGRIRDSWIAAQGVAQNRRQPLRLRLGFKDSRVQRLPWELLYDDDRPLATGLDVTLCRYYQAQTVSDLAAMVPLSPASDPIRLLVIISAPSDQERLALRQEVQNLIDSLQVTRPGDLTLDLTILEQPGRPELAQALEQGKFQILHYAGHSDAGDTGGDLFLVNRQTGLTERLSGEDLAGLLVNNGVRLAVFNSCRGAYTPHDDAQAGWRDQNLVQALVNRGVPGVIAMAERIPDDVALTFTQLLYRNLHQGHPIDLCLSRVRQGLMSAYGSDQPFWMLPLLYLRPDFDGYLYAHDSSAAPDNGFGDDGLVETTLLLPDYSTDPDISSLAAEVFNQQARDAASNGAASPLYDWLQDLEQPEPADAAVTNLVQRLSQPQPSSNGNGPGSDRPLNADPAESLLPQTQPSPTPYPLPPNPTATSTAELVPPLTWALPRRWSVSPNFLVWGSLGLAGLGAVLGLATITLITVNRPTVSDPVEPSVASDAGGVSSTASPALLSGALNAIALGRTDTARPLIEQLLDRNDLTTAESAVSAIPESQLLDPDMAYVRGRLAWQQMVAGSTADTSPSDALRAWTQATEGRPDFLEAWVALGFAHMALNDYDQAIAAWQRAINLDQGQRRDINPDSAPQVAVSETVNAYAGLALAYHKNSELAIAAEEQAQLQQQAQSYFAQTLALDSTMVNPNVLSLNWRWSPTLIGSWQTAVSQLAVSSGGAALETNN
ncbi:MULTISPECIES: CHAT domain-containing protein [Cyanophyceae]|uniref:CHAT domain-containing protein n=1 Tax=Cyanophyceae TaxID=3028117 RepID=UPI00168817F8|nr:MULTISPECIES: CHAT domain-containing protein [unclassified Phormidium]MBD1918010.1 CHAT domain-containing protein [Phormidium sp. FACHB-77]MBD2029258.1 CHAT domain-containing protein [Phormidium sp. FACHB-322]MBD2049790.1 CHAT domain-containing protein [Leptolyngbya sp. FACHB-60]